MALLMNRLNLPGSFDGTVTFRTSIVALHSSEPVEAVALRPGQMPDEALAAREVEVRREGTDLVAVQERRRRLSGSVRGRRLERVLFADRNLHDAAVLVVVPPVDRVGLSVLEEDALELGSDALAVRRGFARVGDDARDRFAFADGHLTHARTIRLGHDLEASTAHRPDGEILEFGGVVARGLAHGVRARLDGDLACRPVVAHRGGAARDLAVDFQRELSRVGRCEFLDDRERRLGTRLGRRPLAVVLVDLRALRRIEAFEILRLAIVGVVEGRDDVAPCLRSVGQGLPDRARVRRMAEAFPDDAVDGDLYRPRSVRL